MERRAFLAAAGISLLPGTARADPLSDGTFRREVLVLLARRHPEWNASPGADARMIDVRSLHVSLDNLYRHVAPLTGGARDAEIVSFVASSLDAAGAVSAGGTFAAVSARLRPQIVPADYLKAAPRLVSRPFVPGLLVGYAVDNPTAYELVLADKLAAWHVDRPELERQAFANAEADAVAIRLERKQSAEGGGAYVSVGEGDGYDAARLLLPRFMARVLATLGTPTAVAAIPNRDFLVAWTPDFAKRQGFAAQVGRDVQTRPHPLTDMLFIASAAGIRPATAAELAENGRTG